MKVIRTILDADKLKDGVPADLLNISNSRSCPGQHRLEWLGQRIRSVPDPLGDSHYFRRTLIFLPRIYSVAHQNSFSMLLGGSDFEANLIGEQQLKRVGRGLGGKKDA